MEKTFFINKHTYNHAKNNQYVIKIIWGNDPGSMVQGYLTNEFQIRTDAKYEPIFNVDGWLESAQKSAAFATGRGLFNTGFWSQLYFKNGGFIILTPEFRIVDWGPSQFSTSPTLRAAEGLTQLCLPVGGPGLIPTEKLKYSIDSTAHLLYDALDGESKTRGQSLEKIKKVVTSPGQLVNDAVSFTKSGLNFIGNLSIDDVTSSNPPSVSVEIGEIFSSSRMGMGFFVESVDCKFSKEMTPRGPLYVDIKLELKTQARPKTSGIKGMGISRVEVTDSSNRPVATPTNPIPSNAAEAINALKNRLNREAGLIP